MCYYNCMEVFNRELALEMVGDEEELLKELERSFVFDKTFDRNQLDLLIQKGDMKEAAGYVHSFKGAARQIAAERAAYAGQLLEDLLRGKSQGDLKSLEENFEKELSLAVATVKSDL